jgi:hypothetical protein
MRGLCRRAREGRRWRWVRHGRRGSARQIAMVCLDELVPADERYRLIDEVVGDWAFVREAAQAY